VSILLLYIKDKPRSDNTVMTFLKEPNYLFLTDNSNFILVVHDLFLGKDNEPRFQNS
jgi:hypothetical protein